jgi:two-component system, OmpR family, sensor histidine kinase KdpD
MPRRRVRRLAVLVGVAVPSLAAATVAVAVLRTTLAPSNAAIVYLAAVVATALAAGAPGAIVAAVASILLYDWFFTVPYYTLTMSDPAEWLNAVLLLGVGLVTGQLAALQRRWADDARQREREAVALFRVSHALATRDTAIAELPRIAAILRDEAGMDRVWIALGPEGRELVAADTGAGARPSGAVVHVLRRSPGEEPATWVRVHQPGSTRLATVAATLFRARLGAGDVQLGSIWGVRAHAADTPDRTETRLLAAAADQAGQALAHDRLAAESRAADVARQSDALKSALLQSVSHDLRTPLATIRAAAGSLRPDSGLDDDDRAESAAAIDREVEYLNRLVTNLLDLSRIEAGALRADRDAFDLDDLVGRTIDRLRDRLGERRLEVSLDAPPVLVDPVFLDDAVTNVLENAVKYTPADAVIRVAARQLEPEPFIRLTLEDGGRGVPDEALTRLFEKFYRVPGGPRGSRAGTGIGLAVVLGLVEAMGGRVAARRSTLGGLAIDLDLAVVDVPVPGAEAAALGALGALTAPGALGVPGAAP